MQKHSVLLGSLVLSASLWCTNALAETIKIGIAGPMSGSVAQYGDMQFQGTHAAIAAINKAGGINGKMIEALEYDDACDPKQAVAVANKLVNDGVKFLVGHLCSSSTQPATDVYEDEGILAVTCSTNPTITERGHEYIFRTIGLDTDQGATAAAYIQASLKPQRIAILHDKQQYGEGIAQQVKDSLEELGIEVTIFEGVSAGDKDFSSIITKLKQQDIDLVYYGGYHPELGLILRQSKQLGFSAQFMGPEAVGNKELSSIAGDASEGLLVTLPARYDLLEQNQEIVAYMQGQQQDPTGPFVWTSVAAVQTMAHFIAIHGEDPTKVADAMRGGSASTAMGELNWDQKGDLIGFEFGVYRWHADGTGTQI